MVMVFRFDVDLRDSAYMDAFDFEKSRKKSFYYATITKF